MDDTALAALNSMVWWELEKHEPFFDMEDLSSGRALAVAYRPYCEKVLGKQWGRYRAVAIPACHRWKMYIGRPGEIEVNVQQARFETVACRRAELTLSESLKERVYLKLGDEDEIEVRDYILPMHETETYQERRKKQDDGCCP